MIVIEVYDEFDEFAAIKIVNNEEVANLKKQLDSFKFKLQKLNNDEITKIFGESQSKPSKTYALPIFEVRRLCFGGLGLGDWLPTLFFPIGQFGAVERYGATYLEGPSVVIWLVYCKVDENFKAIRQQEDLPARLEWDKNCLKELESWYAKNLELFNTESR